MKKPVYLNVLGLTCALGDNKAEVARRLFEGDTSCMVTRDQWVPKQSVIVGEVHAALPPLPTEMLQHNSRNNRLLLHTLQQIQSELNQAINRYGADRVGVVLGTSTSGIQETEKFMAGEISSSQYHYRHQEQGSPAAFVSDYFGIKGPSWVVSTACSSSARAMIAAKRMIDIGLCDAVISGGVDSLCKLTLNGFNALESISPHLCTPFSEHRRGINIGEASAVFLLTREPSEIEFHGGGIAMDAYHLSAPDPEGKGAVRAMQAALKDADASPDDILYINLHGTATQQNDAMETRAVNALFPNGVPCSSTKPMTGHTLGAAAAIEAAFCWLSLASDNDKFRLPPQMGSTPGERLNPGLALTHVGQTYRPANRSLFMSNSFAFGGNNVSLIFGRSS